MLPFYPAFLGAMNLVVLADDAFTFLVAWEFMSLTSWALVMAHHRDPENRRAGYIYIVMASFGTLTLLLAFGLLAGSGGGYAFAEMQGRRGGRCPASSSSWCCWEPAPRPGWCRCTCGCRSPTRPRRATSPP